MAKNKTQPLLQVEGYALAAEVDAIRVLRRERSKQGLSGKEVAERMGVSPSVVSRLENSRQHPSLETLQRYAEAIGCKVGIVVVHHGNTLF